MKFSVVVPLFNKASFVLCAVNSLLAQEVTDLEVLVVDDGSTDDGINRLGTIADSRLVILRQANAGVAVARNAGIAAARGEFICFLDADDFWVPNHLTLLIALIDEDPQAIAWATSFSEFDGCPIIHAGLSGCYAIHQVSRRFDHHDFLFLWARRPFFWTGSITVRAAKLRELQPCFPPGERVGEDQDLWFRLSEYGFIRFIDIRSTAFYRRNVTGSLTSTDVLAPLPAFVRLKHRVRYQLPRERRAALHLYNVHVLHVAWTNCLAGRRAAALGLLWRVMPSARWHYWVRIFVCALLPAGIVRSAVALARSKGVGSK